MQSGIAPSFWYRVRPIRLLPYTSCLDVGCIHRATPTMSTARLARPTRRAIYVNDDIGSSGRTSLFQFEPYSSIYLCTYTFSILGA
ncbi:hypothetical protein I7I53_02142 [Histoplasma capsulatum var. duboisii H88]|uniref:Uncharacterized protein n=1 Tax=Ajellomyces capsulatus (strain H88) TaxID=544711 RepID=A0A8A1LKN0_AJEC8|nr:hypothetical protein I7I53_02142 [Histoplasma capsulatum var. duboisii H88]